MSTLSIAIVVTFIIGYGFIALESVTKVNKAAIALLMFVALWTLFMIDPAQYMPGVAADALATEAGAAIEHHLGVTGTTIFFLLGAMTIVEIVDQNGGFNFVREALRTTSKRRLLWRIVGLAFVLSAILDNMTTSIVMAMLLNKLVAERKDRLIYASLIIIAANSGGAFSPIGDVTTIMLWNKGLITSGGVIGELLLPSLVSAVIPALLLMPQLKGELKPVEIKSKGVQSELTARESKAVFVLGVGGLIFVPIFRYLTGLPPFVGILLVLGVLWTATEIFYRSKKSADGVPFKKRVSNVIRSIDMSTILFFLGILMAVSCLEQIDVLALAGKWLDGASGGNHYLVTGVIGVASSIVDNVPLVAACMGMYPMAALGDFACDGIFWQLLAYCAGVGGSLLIIGSAAGVVVMGIEKITFGWYMKHITWVAFLGYLAGIVCYWAINLLIR